MHVRLSRKGKKKIKKSQQPFSGSSDKHPAQRYIVERQEVSLCGQTAWFKASSTADKHDFEQVI